MKIGTKLGLIFGGLILVFGLTVVGGIVGFSLYSMSKGIDRAREDFKKQTAETIGTITNVRLHTSSKEYTYKYEVNGVSYTGSWLGVRSKAEEKNYDKDVGKKGRVCYDPSNPGSSDFNFSDVYTSDGKKIICGGTSP